MGPISDFTDNELWIVGKTLTERYGHPVETEVASSELRLNSFSTELTECPTLFWSERDANFVIFKVGDRRYRSAFFYSIREQYGTGIDEFDDLTECTVTLLQVQADHEAARGAQQSPDSTDQ